MKDNAGGTAKKPLKKVSPKPKYKKASSPVPAKTKAVKKAQARGTQVPKKKPYTGTAPKPKKYTSGGEVDHEQMRYAEKRLGGGAKPNPTTYQTESMSKPLPRQVPKKPALPRTAPVVRRTAPVNPTAPTLRSPGRTTAPDARYEAAKAAQLSRNRKKLENY